MVQPTGTSSYDPATSETRAATDAPPAPPPSPPPRGTFRKWRARLVVLLLIAAAVLLYLWINQGRVTTAARISLSSVTLTAQAIPVETPRSGQVTAVAVAPQQRVTKGQELGTVEVTTTNSQGEPVVSKIRLTAPQDGIVVDKPVTVGSTLQPGEPFVELYDPTQMVFETDVRLQDLPELAAGMSASLKAEGVNRTVHATVNRVVPRVGTNAANDKANPNALVLVMVPTSTKEVTGLLPGLRFTGSIDTRTGGSGPKLVSMAGYQSLPCAS
jgi:multidrug resistance efflux pump